MTPKKPTTDSTNRGVEENKLICIINFLRRQLKISAFPLSLKNQQPSTRKLQRIILGH